jgi:arylsulfatase A-like enzyme
VLAAAAGWLFAGPGRPGGADLARPGAAQGCNLLLVTLDTVRWDHLGCYGSAAARTQNIDALARAGVRFEQAVASVPLTLPSHATILTGLYPPHHGAHDNGRYLVRPEVETLAESFQTAGYGTAAFVGCFVLDQRYGLGQGFDHYDFQIGSGRYRPKMVDFNERSAGEVSDAAIAWLRGRRAQAPEQPFFIWVHYFDPHLPYQSPLQGLLLFDGRPYDAEIAYVDQELGRLLAELDRLALRERTLVAIVSDHGESLGEHQEATHGMFIYESTVRVPFILSGPGLRPFVERDALAGLVDLAPTVRGLFALPQAEADGVDLFGARPAAGRPVYLETLGPFHNAGWSPLHGLRTLASKFIAAPAPEFYDLARDPQELYNAWGARDEALGLQQALAGLQAGWGAGPSTLRPLDAEERERLASLGYVSLENDARGQSLADPKSMVSLFNDGARAEELYMQGRFPEAVAVAEKVVAGCDECVQAIRVLAFARLKLGRAQEGIALLRERSRALGDAFLTLSLAQLLILYNQLEEASRVLDAYAVMSPQDGQTQILRGDILVMQGRAEAARSAYEEARALDPRRVGPMAEERVQRLGRQAGG